MRLVALSILAATASLGSASTHAESPPSGDPLTGDAIVEQFAACLVSARKNGTDIVTSTHYCGCTVDYAREHARRVGKPPTRAAVVIAQRRCVRFAYNQPKVLRRHATSSAAQPSHISSASLASQVAACRASGSDRAMCICTAERSRPLFREHGRKWLSKRLHRTGFLRPAASCKPEKARL